MGGDDEGEKRRTHKLVALQSLKKKVGVGGLEPSTSASQTQRASRLRYTPAKVKYIVSLADASRFAQRSSFKPSQSATVIHDFMKYTVNDVKLTKPYSQI